MIKLIYVVLQRILYLCPHFIVLVELNKFDLKPNIIMFNSSKNDPNVVQMINNNIIGKGTLIDGNIESIANIRVEGKIIGDIKTKAKAVLSETSVLQGNLQAQNAEVAGELKGKIEVNEMLVLKSTAIIKGEIFTSKLVVESGANFTGTCNMGAVVKDIKIGDKQNSNGEQTHQTQERAAKQLY